VKTNRPIGSGGRRIIFEPFAAGVGPRILFDYAIKSTVFFPRFRVDPWTPRPLDTATGATPLLDPTATPVTELLVRWRSGDGQALDALVPLVYDEMRRLAHRYLRRERPGHTLQSTALVHEAFVRLTGSAPPQWEDRAHFFGIAAHVMRQILVEYARSRKAGKRGGAIVKLAIDNVEERPAKPDLDIIALDDALTDLARMDPQQSRVVELRFFSGLSIEDTARVLGISESTVKRDWNTARVWLYRALDRTASA
jgi:RNA polymerase sigma factor (TIGR02999 family)